MSENERREEAAQEAPVIEVTAEMVEAGFRVLAESGLEGVLEGPDRLLVAEIYRAMSALAPRPSGLLPPDSAR